MSESIHPEIVILEDELITFTYINEGEGPEIVHTRPFRLEEDDSLLVAETPTVREMPFLYNLIATEVEYSQNLQHQLSMASPEERALLHTFFLKVVAARKAAS
jgi:hypothetical protein